MEKRHGNSCGCVKKEEEGLYGDVPNGGVLPLESAGLEYFNFVGCSVSKRELEKKKSHFGEATRKSRVRCQNIQGGIAWHA